MYLYQVKIRIDQTGHADVKAEGYTGQTCTTATKPYIDALGVKIGETPTAEIFQTNEELRQEANR